MTDRLFLSDFATLARVAERTLTGYISRGLPRGNPVPAPDGHVIERGHARPWWKRSTAQRWMDARTGSPGRERDVTSSP